MVQRTDNDGQNVVFVVTDVVENVEVVSVAAVAVVAGGKVQIRKESVKWPRLPLRRRVPLPLSNALSLIYLFIPLSALGGNG